MSKKQNAEELFEIISKDPHSWLGQAQEMKIVADLILIALKGELTIPPTYPETQKKRLAYSGSYMLFTGLAFENLLKGIFIGRNPELVVNGKIQSDILGEKGHGIAEGAKRIIELSQQEAKLLARIQEYLIWAGRYPLPLKLNRFLNSEDQNLRSFRTDDPLVIDRLFKRLVEILKNENWR
jgi:hypothetical protein